ncbi:MAG: hypothetical protein IPH24_02060 [Crocinitomicaceae bacterium]|nr:hypothetical protein [Crocinitomicaceae bacterium]
MNLNLKFITPLFISCVIITSCQSNKASLLGFWRLESATTENGKNELCAPGEQAFYFQFQENGVLRHSYSDVNGRYEIVDDSLYFTNDADKKSWYFLVDQELLTLTGVVDGKTMVQTYSRQVDYKFD